jgi:hypothetical protein
VKNKYVILRHLVDMCLFTSALRASVNKSHIPSLPQNNLYISVITATYQCFGAQSSISRNPGFHKESEITTGSSPHRQHHSGGIYQQEGGAHSPSLSTIVLEFWSHVLKIRSWVTATHIIGILNVDADMASRQFNPRMEWTLDSQIFQKIVDRFYLPARRSICLHQG